MTNVSIILIAQLAVKILGMFYRLVITNIEGFGDSGNGFYQTGRLLANWCLEQEKGDDAR